MVLWRHRSLRRDLVIIIMTISLSAILVTSLSITAISYFNMHDRLISDLRQAAESASRRNDELLPYADVANIQRKLYANLGVFANSRSISLACLYDEEDVLVAHYDSADHDINDKAAASTLTDEQIAQAIKPVLEQYRTECPDAIDDEKMSDEGHYISLFKPVLQRQLVMDDKASPKPRDVGTLYLSADTSSILSYMQQQLLATLIVAIAVMGLSYVLAVKLQRSISQPIGELSDATYNVTIYKDYSVRVKERAGHYSTEIAQLIRSFNEMLTEIEDRDSKLMRKNVELERAKEMAEAANMSKSQFLANISHELRTPLNAIIGFSSIIINQLFGPIGSSKYLDYGQDIHDSGTHLLDIINDILDLSKAEAGKLSLHLEAFDVKEALKKCEHIVSERATDGNIKLHFHMPGEMPEMIADRVRFIQIMLNILSNAIKFTEPGGFVDVSVTVEDVGNEVRYFTFEIKDTGIGMRSEDIDMAFQTFGQVDSGLDRKYEGTGLGLPLTKKLVELHNGSIRMQSEPHKGTRVIIRFISDSALLKV